MLSVQFGAQHNVWAPFLFLTYFTPFCAYNVTCGVSDMYTDVYVDVLFLINISMDAVSLLITSRLCAQSARPWRILAGASAGAVYSVVSVFLPLTGYFDIIVFLCVSVLMSCITFRPDTLRETGRISLVLFISSALLGGVMSALYGVLGNMLGKMLGETSGGVVLSPALFFLLGGVSFIAAMFLCRLHGSGNCPDSGEIEIKIWGKSTRCKGIFDSGNLLCDPLSGRPVIVVKESCVRPISLCGIRDARLCSGMARLDSMTDRERSRFRLIPARGIGGEAYLCGFVPDGLTLEYSHKGRRRRKQTNAIFAVVPDSDIDVECIIPASIV